MHTRLKFIFKSALYLNTLAIELLKAVLSYFKQ